MIRRRHPGPCMHDVKPWVAQARAILVGGLMCDADSTAPRALFCDDSHFWLAIASQLLWLLHDIMPATAC